MIRDIELEDLDRLERLLTPTVQVLPKPKPVVQSYVPPIPFPNRLKVVRKEELSKKQLRKMKAMSLRVEKAKPQACGIHDN